MCLFFMQLAAHNDVKLGEKGIGETVFDKAIGKNYNLRKLKSARDCRRNWIRLNEVRRNGIVQNDEISDET